MLSHTKKPLTLTESVFEPLLESILQTAIHYEISTTSINFLIRIKSYQTLNNRFLDAKDVYYLFTHNLVRYKIYLAQLTDKGMIEHVKTGSYELNGYNVTPKGERVLAYLTTLYNKQTKHNIRAHQDNRLSTKPFKQDKFSQYFGKVKNPNKHLKDKPINYLKDKRLKKGEIVAIREQRAKEAEAEQLEKLNNIQPDKPQDQDQTQKKSSNPFKL